MSDIGLVRRHAGEFGGADRTPEPAALVSALTLIVATRPDAEGRWAVELRAIEVIDFYPRAAS